MQGIGEYTCTEKGSYKSTPNEPYFYSYMGMYKHRKKSV